MLLNDDDFIKSQDSLSGKKEEPMEEMIFQLKDLGSGEVTDIRLNSTFCARDAKTNCKSQSMQISLVENNSWTNFWQEQHDRQELLCEASKKNQINCLKNILAQNNTHIVDVNMKSVDQQGAIHFACFEGHKEVVEILLKAGANPNTTNKHQRSPLHIVCIKGFLLICQILVKAGADINSQDQDQQTPLHYASYNGHVTLVKFLIDKGVNYMIRNSQGLLPIDLARDGIILQCLKSHMGSQSTNYQRQLLGKQVLNNGHKDHVLKLLRSNTQQFIEEQKPEKTVTVHRVKRNMLQSLSKSFVKKNYSFASTSLETPTIGPVDFQVNSCLGKGAFGHVYRVRQKGTQKIYAMKVLNKQLIFVSNLTRYVTTERNVLSVMDCPFIVKLIYAFQTENKLYLVMDYCPGGDLETFLFRRIKLKESLVRLYIAEIVIALEKLHENRIIYRDLKPSNVVIDSQGHACLTDFGLSKQGVEFGARTKSFCGTLAYLAPEMLDKVGHGFSIDWYHLGLLTYELLEGNPPYYNKDKVILFHNIKNASLTLPAQISTQCGSFIQELLVKDPSKRLGSKNDAKDVKAHPFFQGINWQDVLARKLVLPKPQINQTNEEDDDLKITFSTQADTSKDQGEDSQFIENWQFPICDKSFTNNNSFAQI